MFKHRQYQHIGVEQSSDVGHHWEHHMTPVYTPLGQQDGQALRKAFVAVVGGFAHDLAPKRQKPSLQ
eukprot:CAMPEP_0168396868 /NCGR_PEP_ID=MMETSP0228-20121227/20771_1 /TAXON_ID=133427 /ORGANISM="Protoceratium reticulatum, Strain CCCM 535 (=CCMP 1889)" /LENGTH=66 /DNA_ID=CAMNT_0008410325 /DNA_START=662 /DNA_END=862 /DNA_ORIENTATION=+